MDFPINELMSDKASTEWILEHFHPNGLRCPHCDAAWAEASEFRRTKRSQLLVYRCKRCHGIYNLYSGTVFAACHLPPPEVVLVVRGVLKGETAGTLARELGHSPVTILRLRRLLLDNAAQIQPEMPLIDNVVEADEMFQNAGEKRRRTLRPARPTALSCQ